MIIDSKTQYELRTNDLSKIRVHNFKTAKKKFQITEKLQKINSLHCYNKYS